MRLRFDVDTSRQYPELRHAVRQFLADELAQERFVPRPNSWTHYDAGFTKRAADCGFVGLTFPAEFGGRSGTTLERYIVCEEMLAAGAPVGMHWIADRQSGPQILEHGSQEARERLLPAIAAGECCVGIGMSEPGAGSDLAAVRTKATRVDGGWLINGTKLWTSHAHRADFIIALVRTGEPVPQKHAGLTQVIIDMTSDGIQANPILDMAGQRDFNEVVLEDVFVSDAYVLGEPGSGWKLVTGELAYERSGPERFMSSYSLLEAIHTRVGEQPDENGTIQLGRMVTHLTTLRRMSSAIAGMLGQGKSPDFEAALVKDLGAAFEAGVVDVARQSVDDVADAQSGNDYRRLLGEAMLAAPAFTLRGGAREILRSIVAKQLLRNYQ